MNREVQVRFREEVGVKIPFLTRLADALLSVRSDVGASLQSVSAVAKNKFVKKVRWIFVGGEKTLS